eukprot:scaffold61331_cov17-Tisochrysis_lutea.AAC.1
MTATLHPGMEAAARIAGLVAKDGSIQNAPLQWLPHCTQAWKQQRASLSWPAPSFSITAVLQAWNLRRALLSWRPRMSVEAAARIAELAAQAARVPALEAALATLKETLHTAQTRASEAEAAVAPPAPAENQVGEWMKDRGGGDTVSAQPMSPLALQVAC